MKLLTALLVFVMMVFIGGRSWGQNLVGNGGFEEYTQCPNNGDQLNYANSWFNAMIHSSPDYFNFCGTNGFGLPLNFVGYEDAHTGSAYAGIITSADDPFVEGWENYREYMETELLDTMKAGVEYCITFYVSAGDSACYVSDKLGLYFSPSEIIDTCHLCNLSLIPQIEFSSLNNLNLRYGWTELSGSFTANGGERYLIIGNFRDSLNTESTYTGWGSTCPIYQWFAYYYVDDISIAPCDSLTNEIKNTGVANISLSPNPVQNLLTLVLHSFSEGGINLLSPSSAATIAVYDVAGRKIVLPITITNNKAELTTTTLPNGIYLLQIINNSTGVSEVGKFVKE